MGLAAGGELGRPRVCVACQRRACGGRINRLHAGMTRVGERAVFRTNAKIAVPSKITEAKRDLWILGKFKKLTIASYHYRLAASANHSRSR